MKFSNIFLYGLAGFCLGLAQYNPEQKGLLLFISVVAVALDGAFFPSGNSLNIKKKDKSLYAMLKTASVCQFVGLENLNGDINDRYSMITKYIINIANNQNETDKAEILDAFNKLGTYTDLGLVRVTEYINGLG